MSTNPYDQASRYLAKLDPAGFLRWLAPGLVTTLSFRGWLDKVLVRGRTTRDEVVAIFGGHFHDLDRPRRDDVISIEYFLGDTASNQRPRAHITPPDA